MMDDLYGDALVEAAEHINSRTEFTHFARALLQNLRHHPEEWNNMTLEDFFQGLAGFAENMHGYYANVKPGVDCDAPSWRIFADTLLAGRVYE